jgi:hypothetical protein
VRGLRQIGCLRAAYGGPRLPAEREYAPGPSALHAKNDAYDALHVIEALRVQFVGHLDVVVVRSGDFEGEAGGRKLEEPQREVAGVGIVVVRLGIADTSVIVLELTLNDKIVAVVHRGTGVIDTGGLAIERDLEVLVSKWLVRDRACDRGN